MIRTLQNWQGFCLYISENFRLGSSVRDKNRESSEVFADFTISRIPHKTLSSLSVEQLNDVRSALVAQSSETRHSLDIRIRLPLFFRAYYIILFAGRDRRRKTYNLELNRIERLPKGIRRSVYLIVSGSLLVTALIVLAAALYLAKSFAGIDLMPNSHLSDFLPFDLFQEAKELLGVQGPSNEK